MQMEKESNIQYSKYAENAIKALDKPTRRRILETINDSMNDPAKGDIRTIQGKQSDYRLKVEKYRVIFHISGQQIYIDKVDSRGDIYK